MYDLIYGGRTYTQELKNLFPNATIEDASDFIHEDRISVQIEMDEKEYFRIIFLNGFGNMSLQLGLIKADPERTTELLNWLQEWKQNFPQYFKPVAGA